MVGIFSSDTFVLKRFPCESDLSNVCLVVLADILKQPAFLEWPQNDKNNFIALITDDICSRNIPVPRRRGTFAKTYARQKCQAQRSPGLLPHL